MVLLTESCLPPTLVTRGRGVARGWGQPLPPVLTSVRYWSSPSGYCRVSSGLIQEIVIAIIWSAKKKKKYLPQPVKLWSVWTALCDRFQLKTTFMFMLDLCYNIFHFQVWQISEFWQHWPSRRYKRSTECLWTWTWPNSSQYNWFAMTHTVHVAKVHGSQYRIWRVKMTRGVVLGP